MLVRLPHPLVLGLAPFVVTACMSPAPASDRGQTASVPLGIDLGGSRPLQSPGRATPGDIEMAHQGHKDAHATGTVNSVDRAGRKLNISHGPIPEIGWPAMTMDFAVAPSLDLEKVEPGMRINFTIERGQGGVYEIRSLAPMGGAR